MECTVRSTVQRFCSQNTVKSTVHRFCRKNTVKSTVHKFCRKYCNDLKLSIFGGWNVQSGVQSRVLSRDFVVTIQSRVLSIDFGGKIWSSTVQRFCWKYCNDLKLSIFGGWDYSQEYSQEFHSSVSPA